MTLSEPLYLSDLNFLKPRSESSLMLVHGPAINLTINIGAI